MPVAAYERDSSKEDPFSVRIVANPEVEKVGKQGAVAPRPNRLHRLRQRGGDLEQATAGAIVEAIMHRKSTV